jgi:TPR repeat protein
LKCGASQTKAAPTLIKCVFCDAEISDFAKFCEECGAAQNREATGTQEDESAQYRKAADQGDVAAQFNLAVVYENGQGGLAKDDAQALPWYQKAADQGDAEAQYNLGVMFWHRRGGLAPDGAQAVTWYRKAADQGDVDAQFNLGVMYENGQGGFAKDDAQALSWYQKAADQGDAEAQANINWLKQEGENADNPKKDVSIFVGTPLSVASTAFLR